MSNDVEFINVGKTYENGFEAVKSLNLKIKDGEFLVLLGPSGCGKSTTLRMLAGLESVTAGQITIGGSKVNDLPPGARGLGMVFQSYALYPHMSVRENLSFGLRMTTKSLRLPESKIINRVNETAEMLGLNSMLENKPKSLSGGQRQRVAIGRALVRRPKVLLMDEPLSNLDAKLRNQMRIELRKLHELHGTTTVYVTHDQVEAMTLADKVAIMSNSELQQHSPPLEAYQKPKTPFVASFLGMPPMNLIKGKIEAGLFKNEALSFPLPSHLKQKDTNQCTYGVRPENIKFSQSGGIRVLIQNIEYLGDQVIYHLTIDNIHIRVLFNYSELDMSKTSNKPGDTINLELSSSTAVLFE